MLYNIIPELRESGCTAGLTFDLLMIRDLNHILDPQECTNVREKPEGEVCTTIQQKDALWAISQGPTDY